jgi:hypothetical protein
MIIFFREIDVPEDDSVITYRVLRRANVVLETVMKHKVISDFSYILKVCKCTFTDIIFFFELLQIVENLILFAGDK